MQLLSSTKRRVKAPEMYDRVQPDVEEDAPVAQPEKDLDLANVISNCFSHDNKKDNTPNQ